MLLNSISKKLDSNKVSVIILSIEILVVDLNDHGSYRLLVTIFTVTNVTKTNPDLEWA